MIPQGRQNSEYGTPHTEHSTANTDHNLATPAPLTGGLAFGAQPGAPAAPAPARWLRAVPIAEVGTQVTDWSGSRGIILDVEDQAGVLTYLVQFEQRGCGVYCQRIPARALKGVQL